MTTGSEERRASHQPTSQGNDHSRRRTRDGVRSTVAFLGAVVILTVIVNSRYPAPGSFWWSLLPSLDVTVLGIALALLAARRRRPVPRGALAAIAALLVLVRLFRIADGVGIRYFNRPLNLYLDLRLLPELVRLLGATVSRPLLLAGTAGSLLLLLGTALIAWRALRQMEQYLGDRRNRRWTAVGIALLLVASLAWGGPGDAGDRRWGAFGPSVVPRLWREGAFAAHRHEYRQELLARIEANEQRLAELPHSLAGLGGADIFLFLIESYGVTVLNRPEQLREIAPVYARFESALAQRGFSVVSGLLDSPTYAGRSWLAQSTLATGTRTEDAIGFQLLQERHPRAMADFLRAAGYRTVFVQPGTTTPWPERWSYGVDRTYSAWELDYQGPLFRWASMPDQYVIDFVHRREVAPTHGPLFIEYALVSSHAPWSDQPPVVDDWNDLKGGRIFRRLPAVHFPMSWLNLDQAGTAYVRSVAYDLTVLQRYVVDQLPPTALVVVLGDHQPAGDVTGHDPSAAVPIHVISGDRRLTDAFREWGFVSGMRPLTSAGGRVAGMETFLPRFLRSFSTAPPSPALRR